METNIERFILDDAKKELLIAFRKDLLNDNLMYEYLRVFAPTDGKGKLTLLPPKVYHKKDVKLIAIESVAKHGYRFIFDDGFSDVYSVSYLQELVNEYACHWRIYTESLIGGAYSRETIIDITNFY